MNRSLIRGLLFAVLLAVGAELLAAETVASFRAGTDLRKVLDSEVGLQWGQVPLRDGLTDLCRGQPFAIMLDRRIDPDVRVDFVAQGERLEVTLARLSSQQKLDFTTIGPVIYLGPTKTARSLATVAALRRADVANGGAATGKLAVAKLVRWEELSSPRELVEQTAAEYGFKVVNSDAIPHDLWPAGSWPAISAVDRLTLFLAGFDLTFELKEGTIHVVPLPQGEMTMMALHPLRGDAEKAIAAINKMFPGAKAARQGNQLAVKAPFEVQEKVDRLMRGEQIRNIKTGPPQTRYSLKVDAQPAGAVVKTLASALKKELKFAPELRAKLERQVSFEVKDVTVDELLAKTLAPAGLRYELREDVLEILDGE